MAEKGAEKLKRKILSFIMNYTAFNTTDSQALNVKAGDTIHAEIVMDGGNLTENDNELMHNQNKK